MEMQMENAITVGKATAEPCQATEKAMLGTNDHVVINIITG